MEAKAKAACVRALTELYKDDPEALVKAMEEMFGDVQVLPAELEERIKALEAVAHEQELLSPERWKEMIQEIKKHLRPDEDEDDEDEEEENPSANWRELIEEIAKRSPPSPIPPPPYIPHTPRTIPSWEDQHTGAASPYVPRTVIC